MIPFAQMALRAWSFGDLAIAIVVIAAVVALVYVALQKAVERFSGGVLASHRWPHSDRTSRIARITTNATTMIQNTCCTHPGIEMPNW